MHANKSTMHFFENRDLHSKQKNRDSHFSQNRAALLPLGINMRNTSKSIDIALGAHCAEDTDSTPSENTAASTITCLPVSILGRVDLAKLNTVYKYIYNTWDAYISSTHCNSN